MSNPTDSLNRRLAICCKQQGCALKAPRFAASVPCYANANAISVAILAGIVTLLVAKPAIAHPGHGAFIQNLANQTLTPNLTLTGLGIAFLFGSSHALTPGHGKTMVAAYLVGSRGTPKHAVLLGFVTTLTHTLGVFAFGLLALLASQYVLPEQLYPILSFVSGITVCGVGFWLLDSRLHPHDDHHHHPHHPHTHHHDDPPHSHHHHVHHHDHSHHHLAENPMTLPSLVALGIAGGIVPCPSALVLLLSAIALHQATYGMLLVSAFSLGLASVLIAIGLLVVYARQWFYLLPSGNALQQQLPIVSAIAVILVGAVLTACAVM